MEHVLRDLRRRLLPDHLFALQQDWRGSNEGEGAVEEGVEEPAEPAPPPDGREEDVGVEDNAHGEPLDSLLA